MTSEDIEDPADPHEGPARVLEYKYNPGLDAAAGHVEGLRAWRRSQGRDHIQQLDTFYDQGLIAEVLYLVRIGKEASVYCCRGGLNLNARLISASPRRPDDLDLRQAARSESHEDDAAGDTLVAAKVYRARQYRFKNDAVYQEERTRGMVGQAKRALTKKTDFGRKVQTGTWVNHEFETLKELYEAGCDVPKPLLADAEAILMQFIGDDTGPAPQLNRVELNREDAEEQFERVMNNIEVALGCNRIHGDLSAHNILYWDGRVVLIDFPQAVDARFNSQAEVLLRRDIANVCRYFAQFGVSADASRLAGDLWQQWTYGEL